MRTLGTIIMIYDSFCDMKMAVKDMLSKMKMLIVRKKNVIIIIWLVSVSFPAFSQTAPGLYYFNPNQTTVKILYDGKGREVASQEYKVVDVDHNTFFGQSIKYKNGEKVDETRSLFRNNKNNLLISMGKNKAGDYAFLDYPMLHQSEYTIISKLEFKTEGEFAGRRMTVSCKIANREILEISELITTPLGTWTCMKIGYNMEIKSFGIPINVYVVEWFSNAIGIVRTNVYRGGKLHERRELSIIRNS